MDVFRFLFLFVLISAIIAAAKFYKKHPISVAVGCSFLFLLYMVIGLLMIIVELFTQHPTVSRGIVTLFNVLRRIRL